MGVQIQGDTGNVIATKGTYSGNVTIGGTLTYEDVTNVDSIGVITARTNIYLGDSIFHNGDANTRIRFPAADTISAETAGSERLRILSDGKVGINTITPATLLQVVGSTGSTGSSGGTLGIRQKGDTSTDGITLTSSHANSARFYKDVDGALHIYNTGGTNDQFVLRNDGKLGIGTTNPVSNLDVKGAIVANGSYYERSYGVAGSATIDKTITFNSQGVILVLINLSLGNTTTEFSRNIYSLGLFTPRSNGVTWTAIQQDLNSTHVGNFTISDAGTAGALRVQKSGGSDNRQCTFRIDVLSSANTEFTVTDT